MEPYDFLHERVKPIFKGDYQDFSSKNVEGYSLFVSEYKKPHVFTLLIIEIITFKLKFLHFDNANTVNDNAKVYQIIIQKYTSSTECCKGTKSLLYITYY